MNRTGIYARIKWTEQEYKYVSNQSVKNYLSTLRKQSESLLFINSPEVNIPGSAN